ncbi:penicillin-binding transpeptidase domain-containing protein [Saccharibacillus sp. CPCC 101409]|uniref:peptidoglycan D,D-transpeptidase FtsI family protein n=1 Tax=Saccharibacillus sp. CPCC 101409 TaxID=3058041 RepID=UPI0026729A1D|nr:penicillin-binding transpeptidase domain-containing protein [Saccharibacillus sp. CPCC 101409]MDO3411000.1 penicillin-binding transpeptidase domain-containing protein [Saccharibacillus sp. CPCC 101409]
MRIWTREEQDDHRKRRSFNTRMSLFFFTVFAVFAVIILRTASLQFVEAPKLQEEAEDRKTRDIPMEPVRGIIYAKQGEKLAYSVPTQSLYITLKQDFSKGKGLENRPALKTALKEVLKNFSEFGDPNVENPTLKELVGKTILDVDNKVKFGYSPRKVKTDLSDKEVAYFKENKQKYADLMTFEVVEETGRRYDTDTVAPQTIGYVKKFKSVIDPDTGIKVYKDINAGLKKQENQGLQYSEDELVGYYGLEQQYQAELRGENGYQKFGVTAQNTVQGLEEIVPPVKGNDIWTTIDKNVQMKTEEAIANQLSRLPDAISGSAVAMEIDTGNVVAMAEMPDLDPNVYRSGSISEADSKAVEYAYLNGTIRPKPTSETGKNAESVVYLGSTLKPLSVLIGLKEGFYSTGTVYNDKGFATYGRENKDRVQNAGGHVIGNITPARAIEESSNAFMIDMVGEPMYNRYGADSVKVWDKYMHEFGLGVRTGVDLPGESTGGNDYLSGEADNSSVLSRMVFASFGQKGKYTTMQLAQYTAMLANRGERLKPHLVSKITDSKGETVKEFGREVMDKVTYPDEYWNVIQRGMNTQVDEAFKDFPYDFARKTGTSTQGVKPNYFDNGVFIAYAPRENPKLAVAVMVPEGGFGSKSAAPIARAIFDAYDYEYGLDGVPKKSLEKVEEGAEGETGQGGE